MIVSLNFNRGKFIQIMMTLIHIFQVYPALEFFVSASTIRQQTRRIKSRLASKTRATFWTIWRRQIIDFHIST
jgi:hypothetical protein